MKKIYLSFPVIVLTCMLAVPVWAEWDDSNTVYLEDDQDTVWSPSLDNDPPAGMAPGEPIFDYQEPVQESPAPIADQDYVGTWDDGDRSNVVDFSDSYDGSSGWGSEYDSPQPAESWDY